MATKKDEHECDVIHEGRAIKLPAEPSKMKLAQAVDVLQRKMRQEEQFVEVLEVVEAFPWDGALAFTRALRELYGWAESKSSFFEKPTYMAVPTGPDTTEQVLWGNFKVASFEHENAWLGCGALRRDGRFLFQIVGEVQKKHIDEVAVIADKTRELARTQSIYRGKAIRLEVDDEGELMLNQPLSFIDTTTIRPEELIFSTELQEQVQTSLFTPIQHTAAVREAGVPLRRGLLLEGPFGVGKSLTASVTARLCEQNGWTFISLRNVRALADALRFATMYQPCVVQAEDLDQALSGDRDEVVNDLLNTIDGVGTKHDAIITVLTTNNVNAIEQAMLRPGRLDAVISVKAPDADAVMRLIKLYARGLLAAGADLTKAAKVLNGQIPATIREVVERSKLHAISRTGTASIKIDGRDLEHAAKGMMTHLALLNRDRKGTPSPGALIERGLHSIYRSAANGHDLEEANG